MILVLFIMAVTNGVTAIKINMETASNLEPIIIEEEVSTKIIQEEIYQDQKIVYPKEVVTIPGTIAIIENTITILHRHKYILLTINPLEIPKIEVSTHIIKTTTTQTIVGGHRIIDHREDGIIIIPPTITKN